MCASAGDSGEPLKGLRQWGDMVRFFILEGLVNHDVEGGLTWDTSESGEPSWDIILTV